MRIAFLFLSFFALISGGCGSLPKVTVHAIREPPPLTAICLDDVRIYHGEEFKEPTNEDPRTFQVTRVIRGLAESSLRRQGFTVVPCSDPREKIRATIAVSIGIQFSPVVFVKSTAFSDIGPLFELSGYARSRTWSENDIIETQEQLADELARAFRKRIMFPAVPLALGTPAH